jgi:hypothetical protein
MPTIAMAAWLTIAGSAVGVVVPIVNPGFEEVSRPLADGEMSNGCGGSLSVLVGTRPNFFAAPQFVNLVGVPGWRTYLPPPNNPTATVYAGALNPPTFPQGEYITGLEGQHVGYAMISQMQQTLDAVVQPGTLYTLRFRAGIGMFDTENGIYVALCGVPDRETLAFRGQPGVITLVATVGTFAPQNTAGTMREIEISYQSPEVLPSELVGKYLAISLQGSDGIPRMCFDDFRLTATPPGGCPGDANGDGATNAADLSVLLSQFGQNVAVGSGADFNADGAVNGADLSVLLGNFGCE